MPSKKKAKDTAPPPESPASPQAAREAEHGPAQAGTSATAPLVENLLAPEVFASDAQTISLVQGMVSIAFTSARYDYSTTPSVMRKVVVSRLVMPPAAASSMAVRLFAFLEKNGMGAVPKDAKKVQ